MKYLILASIALLCIIYVCFSPETTNIGIFQEGFVVINSIFLDTLEGFCFLIVIVIFSTYFAFTAIYIYKEYNFELTMQAINFKWKTINVTMPKVQIVNLILFTYGIVLIRLLDKCFDFTLSTLALEILISFIPTYMGIYYFIFLGIKKILEFSKKK